MSFLRDMFSNFAKTCHAFASNVFAAITQDEPFFKGLGSTKDLIGVALGRTSKERKLEAEVKEQLRIEKARQIAQKQLDAEKGD